MTVKFAYGKGKNGLKQLGKFELSGPLEMYLDDDALKKLTLQEIADKLVKENKLVDCEVQMSYICIQVVRVVSKEGD